MMSTIFAEEMALLLRPLSGWVGQREHRICSFDCLASSKLALVFTTAIICCSVSEAHADAELSCSSITVKDTVKVLVEKNIPFIEIPDAHFVQTIALDAIRTQSSSERKVACKAHLKVTITESGDNKSLSQGARSAMLIQILRHSRDQELEYEAELTDDREIYVTLISSGEDGE